MISEEQINKFLFSASLKIRKQIINHESLLLSNSFKSENDLDDSELFYTINAFDKDKQLISGTTVFPIDDKCFEPSIDWADATSIPARFNTCYLLHMLQLFGHSHFYARENRDFDPLAVAYIEVNFTFWRQKFISFPLNSAYQVIQNKLWEAECWLLEQPVQPSYLNAENYASFEAILMQNEDEAVDLGKYPLHDIERLIESNKSSVSIPTKGMLDAIMFKYYFEDGFTHLFERADMVSVDIINTWSQRFYLKCNNK